MEKNGKMEKNPTFITKAHVYSMRQTSKNRNGSELQRNTFLCWLTRATRQNITNDLTCIIMAENNKIKGEKKKRTKRTITIIIINITYTRGSVRIAGGVGGVEPPYLILPTPLPLIKIRPRGGRVSTPPPKFF